MNKELLWWLALALLGAAILTDAELGGTASLVVALIATGVTIAAAAVDFPPNDDRRPW